MNKEQKTIFYRQALIPEEVSLEIEHFDEFYEARKELLAKRIKALLNA